MTLTDEIALVTGATRGIGRAIAEALGQAGATVIGTGTRAAGAKAIHQRLQEAGYVGTGMVLDVADPDAVGKVVEQVRTEYGDPTILVNNAAIVRDNLLLRMKEEDWQAVIETDLTAAYRLSRACLRGMMKARHGRIINITSVVGASGNPGQTNYSAAKAGVVGFTRALAQEVASRGITVNAVAPGAIETEMTAELNETQRQRFIEKIPAGRFGQTAEVAQGVLFLASAGAGYINGHTLHINGGMYCA